MKVKIIFAVVLVCAIVISSTFGWGSRDDSFKCEAVRLGHAEWVSDVYGHPEFKWKEVKQ